MCKKFKLKELELYDEKLLKKSIVLCLNKVDLPGGNKAAQHVIKQLNDEKSKPSL